MSSFYLYPLHIQVDCFFREILAPFRNKILSQNALFNNGGKALGNWLHCEKWNAKSNWCNCRLSINGRTFGITLSSFSLSVYLSLSVSQDSPVANKAARCNSFGLTPQGEWGGSCCGVRGQQFIAVRTFWYSSNFCSAAQLSALSLSDNDNDNNKVKWNEKKEGKNESRNEVVACRRMKRAADDDMSPPWLIQNLVENRTIFCQNLSVWVCEQVCVCGCACVWGLFSLVALVLGTGHAPSCSHVKLC